LVRISVDPYKIGTFNIECYTISSSNCIIVQFMLRLIPLEKVLLPSSQNCTFHHHPCLFGFQ